MPDLSPEQAAEFEAALRESVGEWGGKYQVLPAPDEAASKLALLRAAVQRVLDDEETGEGWGPDVTMAAVLKEAMDASSPAAPALLTLVAEGKMSVNVARKALGLPAWPVPEFGEAREIP